MYYISMPTVSSFYGITIKMYWNDHVPPHFHAEYGDFEAIVAIEALEILKGELPKSARRLVLEWAQAHQDELRVAWESARDSREIPKIEPLS